MVKKEQMYIQQTGRVHSTRLIMNVSGGEIESDFGLVFVNFPHFK